MKHLLFALILGLVVSCGSNSSTSPNACNGIAGSYKGNVSDSLSLGADCSYSYTGIDSCRSLGSFTAPSGSAGTSTLTVATSTGGACAAAGTYQCTFVLDPSKLTVGCGGQSATYTKQ